MNTTWHPLSATTSAMRRSPIEERESAAVYISPFLVPVAWRQLKDPKGDVTIEFMYGDDGESTRLLQLPDDVSVKIGKHSLRLYSVRLPYTAIKHAIEKLTTEATAADSVAAGAIERVPDIQRTDNFRITHELFRSGMLQSAGT